MSIKHISIIIPVAKNDISYLHLLDELKKMENRNLFFGEIILVGPDFQDSTEGNFKKIYSPLGRAIQQNRGALEASYPLLWFLHADSSLHMIDFKSLEELVFPHFESIGFFDLQFNKEELGPLLKCLIFFNEIGVHFRSHVFHMPFGDQGFIISKKTFFQLGLFDPTVSYGEDHLLIWRARQNHTPLRFLGSPIITSGRKYKKRGWLKTTMGHLFYTYRQALPEFLKLASPLRKKNKMAIAIFVKTPPFSKVKTRLAKEIGESDAIHFYWQSIKSTTETISQLMLTHADTFDVYWAIAETEGMMTDSWKTFNTIYQGEGELGDRLHKVYSELQKKYDGVILIGADCPIMPINSFIKASQILSDFHHFVIGPSQDGGFYLFGGNQPIEEKIWKSVCYSTSETMSELINLLGNKNIDYLDVYFDVDEIQDLFSLSRYEESSHSSNQSLKKLISWSKKIIQQNQKEEFS